MPEPSRQQGTRPRSGAPDVPQAALNALCVRLGVREDMPALQRIEAEASALFPPGVLPIALTRFTLSEDFASAIDNALLLVAEIGQATSPVGFLLARAGGLADLGDQKQSLVDGACKVFRRREWRESQRQHARRKQGGGFGFDALEGRHVLGDAQPDAERVQSGLRYEWRT